MKKRPIEAPQSYKLFSFYAFHSQKNAQNAKAGGGVNFSPSFNT